LKNVLAKCRNAPQRFSIPGAGQGANTAPRAPALPPTAAIPGVLAAGQPWRVVWSWQGNNVDGPIAGDNGTALFANNDASNIMQLDPSAGLAKIVHPDTNTGGRYRAARTPRCSSLNASSVRPSNNGSLSGRCWRTRSMASRSNASVA
jgi:hypothetical protein